ncbi:MAG: hypothetical protein JKY67_19880 [Pseudomonadales bacterium]|nr:hypothetical protein [Pseudomonadales bacterium]
MCNSEVNVIMGAALVLSAAVFSPATFAEIGEGDFYWGLNEHNLISKDDGVGNLNLAAVGGTIGKQITDALSVEGTIAIGVTDDSVSFPVVYPGNQTVDIGGEKYELGRAGLEGDVAVKMEVKTLMGVSLNYRQLIGYSDRFSWYGKVGAYNLKLNSDAVTTFNTSLGVLTDVNSGTVTVNKIAAGFGVSYLLDGFGDFRLGYERYGSEVASIALNWRRGFDY